jgi:uncharacterized small protein (DUF1192 family)
LQACEEEAAMDWDDLKPKPAKAVTVGEDLRNLGLAELEARVAMLQAEIVRVRAEIEQKRKISQAAAAAFKS